MLMLVTGLAFASCSDDDEGSNPSDLVGTWTVTSSYYAYYTDGDLMWEYTDNEVGSVWKFYADGTISAMDGSETGTWTVKGNKLIVTEVSDDETYVHSYTLTRNDNEEITLRSEDTYTDDGSTYREVYSVTLDRNS